VVISLHREAKKKKKKQGIVAHSSVEAEFKGMCHLDLIKRYGSDFYYGFLLHDLGCSSR
jgi:hypothetical protein